MIKHHLLAALAAGLIFTTGCATLSPPPAAPGASVAPAAPGAPGEQCATAFEKTITKTLSAQYLLYLPEEYGADADREWPLMVFLHGAGERGDNLDKVKVHGPPKLVGQGQKFPFIIVSPQCPKEQWWDVETLDHLLDEIVARHRVDVSRIYLTGLSMGGFGSWEWAMGRPERFAAIAPICGGGMVFHVGRLKDVPVWAFHGAKDNVVPLEKSQEMVDRLNQKKGSAKLTVYPDAGHDSWTKTYENPKLFKWFLSHAKATP